MSDENLTKKDFEEFRSNAFFHLTKEVFIIKGKVALLVPITVAVLGGIAGLIILAFV